MSQSSNLVEPGWYRFSKGVFSGTCAGITVTLVGHPFDTLKVRLQVQSAANPIYNGLVDCFTKTLKWEGVAGLYKGVASPLAAQLFFRTCLFTTFYESNEYFAKKSGKKITELKRHEYYLSGLATGFLSTFIDSPQDLFKSKMQIQILSEKMGFHAETKYSGVFDCGRKIFRDHGLRGIYQGAAPTFLRNSIGYCLYFGSFEAMKRMALREDQRLDQIEFYKVITCGAIGGILFWVAIYNIDVVKSAMMADNVDPTKRKFKNSLDCCKYLLQHEGGYRRLWRGFLPCLMRSAPANGLMLYSVDIARNLFVDYKTIDSFI